jgi:hypothetical protein
VYPCSKVYCLLKLKNGKSESHFEDSKRPVSCDPSAFSCFKIVHVIVTLLRVLVLRL